MQPAFSSVNVKFDYNQQNIIQVLAFNLNLNNDLSLSLFQAPTKISSIFNGERQIVYAFAGITSHSST